MPEAEPPADAPLFCARCAAELHPGQGDFYVVRIEALADPTPPSFSAEDLARDTRAEIADLLARLEGLSDRELMDQVYRRMVLHLCLPCYREWIERPAG
jgi:hypothetical protein